MQQAEVAGVDHIGSSIQSTSGHDSMKRAAQPLQTAFLQAMVANPWHNPPHRTMNSMQCCHSCCNCSTFPLLCLQEYTFTLTQGDGARVQGFCRRFLPPAPRVGSKLRYPQVLCLVCEASWSTLFFKVSACCGWPR
jgi:hypothetical protein